MKFDVNGDPVRFWWNPSEEQDDVDDGLSNAERRDSRQESRRPHTDHDPLERTVAFLPREGAELEWVEWAIGEPYGYNSARPTNQPTAKAAAVVVSGR